jgi:hypothetical protein
MKTQCFATRNCVKASKLRQAIVQTLLHYRNHCIIYGSRLTSRLLNFIYIWQYEGMYTKYKRHETPISVPTLHNKPQKQMRIKLLREVFQTARRHKNVLQTKEVNTPTRYIKRLFYYNYCMNTSKGTLYL